MPLSWLPRASTCPGIPETRPLVGCLSPAPGLLTGELDIVAVPLRQFQRQLSMQGGPSQVCVRVRACACAALTCRLLTEVFVCTQASELGATCAPPATLRAAPLSQAPLGPRCVSLPPAHRPCRPGPCSSLPSPAFPSFPRAASWNSHGPLQTLLPQMDIWLGKLGAPTWTECQEGVAMRGIKTPPDSPDRGAPSERMCYRCYRPCLSLCLSVCVSVTVREGCLQAGMG